jgi:stress response protein SCP2
LDRDIELTIAVDGSGGYECRCFALSLRDELLGDEFMIWSRRAASPGRAIVLAASGGTSAFTLSLSRLPSEAGQLVFVCGQADGGPMGLVRSLSSALSQGGKRFSLDLNGVVSSLDQAFIPVVIYKADGAWCLFAKAEAAPLDLRGIESRYCGGGPPPKAQKRWKEAPELAPLGMILSNVIADYGLDKIVARVVLVLDITGSMRPMYSAGSVQAVVKKIFPLAVQFDPDERLDLWFFGKSCRKMPQVTLHSYKTAVPADWQTLYESLGGVNNEPAVMQEVIAESESKGSGFPTLVIFVTDGGASNSEAIKRQLFSSADKPIFWQFVGLGAKKNYGVLARFDALKGRFVDNTGFFAFDDFLNVDETELYTRLLGKFPKWLKEAKAKGLY